MGRMAFSLAIHFWDYEAPDTFQITTFSFWVLQIVVSAKRYVWLPCLVPYALRWMGFHKSSTRTAPGHVQEAHIVI